MINIKPIQKSDIIELIEIEKDVYGYSLYKEDFENYFYKDAINIWKISTRKIIGFVCFYNVKDEIEIIQVCIIKSYQRKNYGSLIISKLKKLNIKKIFLEVSSENTQAKNFYLKHGFKKIGIRKDYYRGNKQRIDAIRLLFKF